jgi:hypothetical protein
LQTSVIMGPDFTVRLDVGCLMDLGWIEWLAGWTGEGDRKAPPCPWPEDREEEKEPTGTSAFQGVKSRRHGPLPACRETGDGAEAIERVGEALAWVCRDASPHPNPLPGGEGTRGEGGRGDVSP